MYHNIQQHITSLTKIEPNYISILRTIYKKIKFDRGRIYTFIKVKRIWLDQSDVLSKKFKIILSDRSSDDVSILKIDRSMIKRNYHMILFSCSDYLINYLIIRLLRSVHPIFNFWSEGVAFNRDLIRDMIKPITHIRLVDSYGVSHPLILRFML